MPAPLLALGPVVLLAASRCGCGREPFVVDSDLSSDDVITHLQPPTL
jgi:hypothetical protein